MMQQCTPVKGNFRMRAVMIANDAGSLAPLNFAVHGNARALATYNHLQERLIVCRMACASRPRCTQVTDINYDIVGHPRCGFRFVTCFPFHPATSEHSSRVTLLREYCQGPNSELYNLPTGTTQAHASQHNKL